HQRRCDVGRTSLALVVIAVVGAAVAGEAAAGDAQVAEPVHEVEGYVRTRELFDAINRDVRPSYSGSISLFGGASVSGGITALIIDPHAWIIPFDGRTGIDLALSAAARLDLSSDQFLCGYHGAVQCTGDTSISGFLDDTNVPVGLCTDPSFRALSVAFDIV